MTLSDLQTMLVTIVPGIKHYWIMGHGQAYTYWEETRRLPLMADDRHIEEGWVFYVHHFTRDESDTVPGTLFAGLDGKPNVTVSWEVTYEQDTGYIHHIFSCEVV